MDRLPRNQKIIFPKLNTGGSGCQLPNLNPNPLFTRRSEEKPAYRVLRTKRKHVQRACERCRVKKSKCDGNQPCSRCTSYNQACIFRERKATPNKVYSRGFVEMLISQHALHLQAVRDLYKRCVTGEGFPGTPLQESIQGYPGTHAILDRLGLIKNAEEAIENPQKVLTDITDYLKGLDTVPDCLDSAESTDTGDTTVSGEGSPEPKTPKESVGLAMPYATCPWTGTVDHHWQYHTRDEYKPMQQQQHIDTPATTVPDNMCVESNTDSSETSWGYCSSQLRYMPTEIDVVCDKTESPVDMSWPVMANHSSAASFTQGETQDNNTLEPAPFYNQSHFLPEIQAYVHDYGNSSVQNQCPRQFRHAAGYGLLNPSSSSTSNRFFFP